MTLNAMGGHVWSNESFSDQKSCLDAWIRYSSTTLFEGIVRHAIGFELPRECVYHNKEEHATQKKAHYSGSVQMYLALFRI